MGERNRQGEPRRSIRRLLGISVCETTVVDDVTASDPGTIDEAGVETVPSAEIVDFMPRLEHAAKCKAVERYLSGHQLYIDDNFLPPVA